jgi:hypothetical protein
MMNDDDPSTVETASPRTTIVGGRPPEQPGGAPPVPTGIQRLLRLASVDESFRRELLERRGEIAEVVGIELTSSEHAVLAAIPAEQLRDMAAKLPLPPEPRRDFLRRSAATAVVLLGGAALGESVGACRRQTPGPPEPTPSRPDGPPAPQGIQPDMPPERPEHRETETEGGAAPDMPPEPPPTRPNYPPPPTGIQPDLPPERPERRSTETDGGINPELPPERPTTRETTTKGGADPNLAR